VRVNVNETRRNGETLRSNHALRVTRSELADRRNPSVANPNVAAKPGIAAAIDDAAVLNEEIELELGERRRGKQKDEEYQASGELVQLNFSKGSTRAL